MRKVYRDPYISELFYVACLKTLLSAYIAPLSNNLQQTKCMDDGKDYSALLLTFGGDILELLACHQAILNELQTNSHNVSETAHTFCIALLKAIPAMRVAYQAYALRFASNMDLARHAKSSVPACVWCRSYSALARGTIANNLANLGLDEQHATAIAENTNITLDALAVLPIQRIARYSVNLKGLMNACSERSMKENVSGIIKTLQSLCSSVEEVQLSSEQLRKLSELEKVIGTGTKEVVRLINEGDLECLHGRKRHRGKVILLSKCLVVAYTSSKSVESSKKKVERIPLSNILSVRRASPKIAGRSGFEISYASQSHCLWKRRESHRQVVALTTSEADAILWVRDITQAVDDLTRLE